VPALLLVAALLLTPSAMTADVASETLGVAAHAELDGDGARARADSPAGWQQADVAAACLPDWDSQCDTEADCLPDSLNCWATRRPRESGPCHYAPDGTLHCHVDDPEP
jgi:hypothetical protein